MLSIMDVRPVHGFFKFGRREHMEQFVSGTLYMNTLDYFAKMEEAEYADLRCDAFEGVGRLLPFQGATLSFKISENDEFRPMMQIADPVKWTPTGGIKANVFCLYALRPPEGPVFIDEKNFRFGDTYVVILNGDEFLRRVKVAVQATVHQLEYDLMEYFDEGTYAGPVGIFKKRSAFRYQSEFRIALIPGVDAPYRLEVGDLSNITQTGVLSELNQRLRYAPCTS